MNFEHVFDLLAPYILPPLILGLVGWLGAVLSGLTKKAADWMDAHQQAAASRVLGEASTRLQAAMQNEAGQIALEAQQGQLNLKDLKAVAQRLQVGVTEVTRKVSGPIATLQPADGAILGGIRGKITGALPVPDPISALSAPPPTSPAPAPTPPSSSEPDRKDFFDAVRVSVFGGRLVQSQVDGCNKIVDFWHNASPSNDARPLSYALATAFWETAHTMRPVEEIGRGKGRFYGPSGFYGRGLAQLSLEPNYRRMSAVVGVDLVAHPERALEWPIALQILFAGMTLGLFTGKKLSDYFSDTTDDPVGARAIVNGSDRAEEIAGIYRSFLAALQVEVQREMAA